MSHCFQKIVTSPIGPLTLQANNTSLTAIHFGEEPRTAERAEKSALLNHAAMQLSEYFDGQRREFDLPLAPSGTDFEQSVWQIVRDTAWGATTTYGEIARAMGDRNKVRAVGRANGRNPLPVIIGCHRVIGADNKLTGYAGGIEKKRWLLQHEGILLL